MWKANSAWVVVGLAFQVVVWFLGGTLFPVRH